jgi:hypothetical protein
VGVVVLGKAWQTLVQEWAGRLEVVALGKS